MSQQITFACHLQITDPIKTKCEISCVAINHQPSKLGPSQIWNVDETGFPMNPQKSNVIAPVGEVSFTTSDGPGRENITVLGVCNGAGRVLDPLIIFQGKNLQSTWRGNKAFPKAFYSISEKGWMTAGIFADWFKQFVKEVEERTLLIIRDGHMAAYDSCIN